jgi:hypothetical protein
MDWLLTFGQKVLAIPGLHAILAAWGAGMAVTYALSLPWPASTASKTVIAYSRLITFVTVMTVALYLLPTPVMFAWAFTVAIMTPLFYEWVMTILYHKFPWLKPKALLTAPEMQARVAQKETQQ